MPVSLTLFLAAMAASLMVSGAAAIAALREPALGLKPLWALLALTGLGGAALCTASSTCSYCCGPVTARTRGCAPVI